MVFAGLGPKVHALKEVCFRFALDKHPFFLLEKRYQVISWFRVAVIHFSRSRFSLFDGVVSEKVHFAVRHKGAAFVGIIKYVSSEEIYYMVVACRHNGSMTPVSREVFVPHPPVVALLNKEAMINSFCESLEKLAIGNILRMQCLDPLGVSRVRLVGEELEKVLPGGLKASSNRFLLHTLPLGLSFGLVVEVVPQTTIR